MKRTFSLVFARVVAVLLAGALSGCVTYRQVQQIVADSNATILAHQLGGDVDLLVTADGTDGKNEFDGAAAQIEAFIAAHPEQKTTAAALRIRQAMLFLTAGKPELARAAFNAADTNLLFTARDQTLAAMSASLVWWFSAAPKDVQWSNRDRDTNAVVALNNFRNLQTHLTSSLKDHPENEGIRDYVAETRAWIGLKKATSHGDAAKARVVFEDAITFYYTNTIGVRPVDVQLLQCGCTNAPSLRALPPAVRRCFRTKVLFGYAKEVWKGKADTGDFDPNLPDELKQMIRPAP
ncbi:MAG TPA: hypothetical protein VFZ59_11630 [Verrucomicrobiae bacterium]|nr:hypothetical protein [Verrucomicrobiae bacterium]